MMRDLKTGIMFLTRTKKKKCGTEASKAIEMFLRDLTHKIGPSLPSPRMWSRAAEPAEGAG